LAKHTVQVGDGSGNSFNMIVDVSFFTGQGSWRVPQDVGYLKYTSGIASEISSGFGGDMTLYLYGTGGVSAGWGIRLDVYESAFSGTNDAGTGEVVQPWVLQLSPGAISWALAD
jgi:hypothetical protein